MSVIRLHTKLKYFELLADYWNSVILCLGIDCNVGTACETPASPTPILTTKNSADFSYTGWAIHTHILLTLLSFSRASSLQSHPQYNPSGGPAPRPYIFTARVQTISDLSPSAQNALYHFKKYWSCSAWLNRQVRMFMLQYPRVLVGTKLHKVVSSGPSDCKYTL